MLTLEGLGIVQGGFSLRADLTVPTGARVAVIGPSGAGKSTLLAVIAGFLAPQSGRVLWDQSDISGAEPGARPLSIIFQDNNLFPHLTVFQNVALGISPSLKLNEADQARVAANLTRVGLADMADRKPAALSGGQQSRVALARVMLRHKPLLLLDEPFAALGPALKADMLDLVRDLAAETGTTVLMVTHDPRDAQRFADQTILVADGLVTPPQPTKALFADPPQALRDYLE
jgi:thiamine transport system ATP-binding protein